MNKQRRELIANNQVSRMMTFSLGGYEQKVLLDGKSETSPVVLFLHGGPGGPVPFSAGCRGLYPNFTEHFIMAYWDQLGCGINNHPLDDSFTIGNFVDMTTDLIRALKQEFPNNLLALVGVSWGSVLAARAAAELPDLVDAVLVYGQVLKDMFFNDEVFETLHAAGLPQKAMDEAEALRAKPLHTTEEIIAISKLITKYTDGYQCKAGGKLPMGKMIWGLLSSPDYSLKDFLAVLSNGTVKNHSLLNELMPQDLRDVLREVRVPYHILQGSTDIVTSTKNISAFMAENTNAYLSLRVLPNNGHVPGPDGMEEVLAEGLQMLRDIQAARTAET